MGGLTIAIVVVQKVCGCWLYPEKHQLTFMCQSDFVFQKAAAMTIGEGRLSEKTYRLECVRQEKEVTATAQDREGIAAGLTIASN